MTTHVQQWDQYRYFDYQNGYDSSDDDLDNYEYDDERYEAQRYGTCDVEAQRENDAAAHAEHVFKIRACAAVWLTTVALYLLTWYLKLPEFMCLMMWLIMFPLVSLRVFLSESY